MKLHQREGFVWFDGQFIPNHEAKVHALTNTLHYGVGAFEGVRAYETTTGAAIFRLHDHTRRLFRSAKILNITLPYTMEILNDAQTKLIAKNQLTSAYIRPVVFYGSDHLGVCPNDLTVHVAIGAWEWPRYFNVDDPRQGIKAHISTYQRHHVGSSLLKAKANGNYINSALALQEAKSMGCEEAILLDARGYVSEGSSSNIFMVRDKTLFTPTTATILEGITRQTVMTLANDLNLSVIEKDITRDDLYTADEIFFTGTAAEVTAVSRVDNRVVGNGYKGEVTQILQDRYTALVHGQVEAYPQWLTPINLK